MNNSPLSQYFLRQCTLLSELDKCAIFHDDLFYVSIEVCSLSFFLEQCNASNATSLYLITFGHFFDRGEEFSALPFVRRKISVLSVDHTWSLRFKALLLSLFDENVNLINKLESISFDRQ